jgi:hypothetical protein
VFVIGDLDWRFVNRQSRITNQQPITDHKSKIYNQPVPCPVSMSYTFISYRREDSAGYAGRLHEDLEERIGARQVFRDVDTLQAGQDFEAAIRQRLAQCSSCVVMIGPGWLRSQTASGQRRLDQPGDYVVMEIAAALARPDVVVIPVLVGGATMPLADELPQAIRPLARRQALSIRDETWSADMARLARAVTNGRSQPLAGAAVADRVPALQPEHSGRRSPLVIAGLAIAGIVLVALLAWLFRSASPPTDVASNGSTTGGAESAAAAEGPAYAIDIPTSGAEVAYGNLIYTPLAGSVQRRGSSTRVWLRMRVSNEGFSGANVWDASFRLVVGGSDIAASGGLDEVLDHRSIRQYVIRFDVPGKPAKAILRIVSQDKRADVPLDLTSNGQPAHHEDADEGDALSRATFTSVANKPLPLVEKDDMVMSVSRISNRHFVNAQRIRMDVEWKNGGRYAVATGDLVLRLEAGGETLAPTSSPSEAVDGGSTYHGDVVFEVPPKTRQATLKATFRDATHEVRLTLN